MITIKNIVVKYRLEIIVFVVVLVYVLFRLGANALNDYDEANYAAVSRNIINSGDWFDLRWISGSWFEKPPLFFWLTALSFDIFGISEFSARIVSALSGVGIIFLTYVWTFKLTGEKVWAVFSTAIFLSSGHFISLTRSGMTDILLTFFISLTLWYSLKGLGSKRLIFYVLSGVFLGLAMLTKQVVGMLPVVILFFYIIACRNWGALSIKGLLLAIVSFAIILVPWHLYMFNTYGKGFFDIYILSHVIDRTTSGNLGHSAPFYWYVEALFNVYRPWVFILPIVFITNIVDFLRGNKVIGLFVLWAVVIIGLFSLSVDKLHWYIIPMYPALTILIVNHFKKLTGKVFFGKARWVFILWTISGLLFSFFQKDFKTTFIVFVVLNSLFLVVILFNKFLKIYFSDNFLGYVLVPIIVFFIVANLLKLPGPGSSNNDLKVVCEGVDLSRGNAQLYLVGFAYQGATYYCTEGSITVSMIEPSMVPALNPPDDTTYYFLIKESAFSSEGLGREYVYRKSGDTLLLKLP